MLTAFYMFRLLFVVFFGPAKSEGAGHAHESPKVMTTPLIILAVFSAIGGFIGIDVFVGKMFTVTAKRITAAGSNRMLQPFGHNLLAAMFGLLAALVGISLAATCYWNATKDPLAVKLGWLSRAMRNRFYFDELYAWLISITHEALSKLADWFDRWIIAGLGRPRRARHDRNLWPRAAHGADRQSPDLRVPVRPRRGAGADSCSQIACRSLPTSSSSRSSAR